MIHQGSRTTIERSGEEPKQADHVEGLTAVFSGGEKAFPEFYGGSVQMARSASK